MHVVPACHLAQRYFVGTDLTRWISRFPLSGLMVATNHPRSIPSSQTLGTRSTHLRKCLYLDGGKQQCKTVTVVADERPGA